MFIPPHFGSEDLLIFITRLYCDVLQFVYLKKYLQVKLFKSYREEE